MVNINISYEDSLEWMSMGIEFKNGNYLCTDGVMVISGECSEEIDFVEFGNIELRKAM